MIRIYSAKANSPMAYSALGFGPFSPDGEDLFDEFSFRSPFDDLRERPGIHGENHVNHRQISADLYANPWHGVVPCDNGTTRAYAKTSSGGWSTTNISTWNCAYWPAHPWTVITNDTSRNRFEYHAKDNPFTRKILRVWWYYNSVLRRYQVERAFYSENWCNAPATGDSFVTVFAVDWTSNYRPDSSIYSSLRPTAQSSLLFASDLIRVAREGTELRSKPGTLAFPFYLKHKAGEVGNMSKVLSRVLSSTEDSHEVPGDIKSFGELAGEAVDTLDTNGINMFEFLQGFKNPKDLVPKLKNLSQLKTHAGNHLAVQYGILPTISDLESLMEAVTGSAKPYFDSNNYQVLTAGHSVSSQGARGRISRTNRIKIALNTVDLRLYTLSERLRDIGGFPSIDNLWDLVPYSFVVDWFINVGDMLESLDDRFRISTLPIVYATTSSKLGITPNFGETLMELGYHGDVQITYYDRNVSMKCPTPPLNFEVSNALPANWLEAGALIVTARK